MHLHDRTQRRQLVTDGAKLRELFGVFDDRDARLAVRGDVLTLFRRARGVDTGGNRAGRDRAQIGDEPLGTIEAEYGDAFPWLESQRDEAARREPDLLSVLAPGGRLPLTVSLDAQRRLIGIGAGRAIEDVGHAKRHVTRQGVVEFSPVP